LIGGGILAKRYAKALFGLGNELGSPQIILESLRDIVALADESPELRRVLFTPLYPREERRAVLRALAPRLAWSDAVRAFMLILVDESRTTLIPAIYEALRELVDRSAGRVEAHVRSARPLTPEQHQRLAASLSRRLGAQVTLRAEVDPALVGGVVARIGDLLLDGSVKTQLAGLADSLRRQPE
jgi:F-type H+-transporting ATPase subunit delta